jgi:hypothetical protein
MRRRSGARFLDPGEPAGPRVGRGVPNMARPPAAVALGATGGWTRALALSFRQEFAEKLLVVILSGLSRRAVEAKNLLFD